MDARSEADEVTEEELATLEIDHAAFSARREALLQVVEVLAPVFATSTFVVDEEIAADLLEKAEALDPVRKVQTTEIDQSVPEPAALAVEETLLN